MYQSTSNNDSVSVNVNKNMDQNLDKVEVEDIVSPEEFEIFKSRVLVMMSTLSNGGDLKTAVEGFERYLSTNNSLDNTIHILSFLAEGDSEISKKLDLLVNLKEKKDRLTRFS